MRSVCILVCLFVYSSRTDRTELDRTGVAVQFFSKSQKRMVNQAILRFFKISNFKLSRFNWVASIAILGSWISKFRSAAELQLIDLFNLPTIQPRPVLAIMRALYHLEMSIACLLIIQLIFASSSGLALEVSPLDCCWDWPAKLADREVGRARAREKEA